MLVRLVEKHKKLIKSWSVSEFDQDGPNTRFKGTIIFFDESVLHIKQIIIGELTFKYAYHWQDREGNLICRWDNSPHWPNIVTYPHHKHIIIKSKVVIKESHGGDPDKVLEEVSQMIGQNESTG